MPNEVPHDKVMTGARNLALRTVEAMGVIAPAWAHGDGVERGMGNKGLGVDAAFAILESFLGNDGLVVAGDWRVNERIDVYDLAMRFAEDNYSRMRHEKYDNGMYVIVMHGPLKKET